MDEIRKEMDIQNFGHPMVGPVEVKATFYLERPKTVKRDSPSVRPDVDKLLRALLDALTQSGVIGDDAQVCRVYADKTYAEGNPHTFINIGSLDAE